MKLEDQDQKPQQDNGMTAMDLGHWFKSVFHLSQVISKWSDLYSFKDY